MTRHGTDQRARQQRTAKYSIFTYTSPRQNRRTADSVGTIRIRSHARANSGRIPAKAILTTHSDADVDTEDLAQFREAWKSLVMQFLTLSQSVH